MDTALRHEIWQGLLDASRCARYYEALYNRYQRRHQITRVVLLASATGVIGLLSANLIEPWTDALQAVLGGLIVLVVIVDLVGRFAEKAAVLHVISVDCSKLDNEWHQLWADCEEPGASRNELASRHSGSPHSGATATSGTMAGEKACQGRGTTICRVAADLWTQQQASARQAAALVAVEVSRQRNCPTADREVALQPVPMVADIGQPLAQARLGESGPPATLRSARPARYAPGARRAGLRRVHPGSPSR